MLTRLQPVRSGQGQPAQQRQSSFHQVKTVSVSFRADCEKCLGLCCVALRFSRADGFGHDKSAGEPCHYLEANRCRIHAQRDDLGYEGCIDFDCLGAGQRASAAFADPENPDRGDVAALYARFHALMPIQEMRQALADAADLELPEGDHDRRVGVLDALALLADGASTPLDAETCQDILVEARALIAGWKEL